MTYEKRSALAMFWRSGGWIALLLIFAGIGIGLYNATSRQAASLLASDGAEAFGEVTNKTRSKSNKSYSYRVSYSFPTPDDPYTRGLQNVTVEFYDSVEVGGPVSVRYLPGDPTISEVDIGRTATMGWRGLALTIGLLAAGIGGSGFLIGKARALIGLRDHGEMREATVTSHAVDPKQKANTKDQARALWTDAKGGSGRSRPDDPGKLPPVGDTITIFADPAGRIDAVWEGDVGSR